MGLTPVDAEVLDRALIRLEKAPPAIVRHSRRMITWAHQLAEAGGVAVDPLGLGCACAFHDLGLTGVGPAAFPVRSADLLAAFFVEHGVQADRATPWLSAVRDHLRLRPPAGESREASLLRRAAWLDAVGVGDWTARQIRRAGGVRGVDLRLLLPIASGCARDALGRPLRLVRPGVRRRSPRAGASWNEPA